jgi:hypothetical protein
MLLETRRSHDPPRRQHHAHAGWSITIKIIASGVQMQGFIMVDMIVPA